MVHDSLNKNVFAHAVDKKGADEDGYAVQCLVKDVQWLGFTRIILKTDNESSIVRLLRESLKALRIDTTCGDGEGMQQVSEEHPPPYDPKANGAVEAAVKSVKGLCRTMLYGLQLRIARKIPPTHPIIAWMVTHAAAVLRWRNKGRDGRTPYERTRGRPFTTRLVEFGEFVKFKVRNNGEPSNLEARWKHGVFIGMCMQTGQYSMFYDNKVVYARSIARMPDSNKWKHDKIEEVNMAMEECRTPRARGYLS